MSVDNTTSPGVTMTGSTQTITQPFASASVRAAIALFAVVAAFLLVTGAGFASGSLQGLGNDSTSQARPPGIAPGEKP
jgi:hypothetical protein